MVVIRGNYPNLEFIKRFQNKAAAVTIGAYDGLHLGHQYIFKKLSEKAKRHQLIRVLITFEPRPADYFNNLNHSDKKTDRLTLLSDKLRILAQTDFDLIWIINFNSVTANSSADDFIAKINKIFKIHSLYIGHDFKFGKNRSGNFTFLEQQANIYHYQLFEMNSFQIDQIRVSSSYIRDLALNTTSSNLALIKKFMGRYYGFSGKVITGQKKGRELGFPTINIHVKPQQLKLARGVYAVNITYGSVTFQAMANWGYRPTLVKKLELVLEAHIFDFNQDVYGQRIYIEFIAKIRDEHKFNSITELQQQLHLDKQSTLSLFSI